MIANLALTQALSGWRTSCLVAEDYLVLVKDGGQSLSNNTLTRRGEMPGEWKQQDAMSVFK
jgi:hypothetical protein